MGKEFLLAGCGVGLGAGLMYVLDPERGKRRRAYLRDQALHSAKQVRGKLGKKALDIRNRASGLVAEAGTHFRCEEVSDEVLTERVRSQMGRVVSDPGDIEVSASDGLVTLRGIVLAQEAERLLRRVSKVHGVRGVENQLKVKRPHGVALGAKSENGAGNNKNGDGNPSVSRRLLATVAGSGLALYGAKRRGVVGSLVSLVGVNLLRRGLREC